MLEDLLWSMGGDSIKALDFLLLAVAADPAYAHARLDLAKLFVKKILRRRAVSWRCFFNYLILTPGVTAIDLKRKNYWEN